MDCCYIKTKKDIVNLLMRGGKWKPKGYRGYCYFDETENTPFRFMPNGDKSHCSLNMDGVWGNIETTWVKAEEYETQYKWLVDEDGAILLSGDTYASAEDVIKRYGCEVTPLRKVPETEVKVKLC
jgi:hypothetical protein